MISDRAKSQSNRAGMAVDHHLGKINQHPEGSDQRNWHSQAATHFQEAKKHYLKGNEAKGDASFAKGKEFHDKTLNVIKPVTTPISGETGNVHNWFAKNDNLHLGKSSEEISHKLYDESLDNNEHLLDYQTEHQTGKDLTDSLISHAKYDEPIHPRNFKLAQHFDKMMDASGLKHDLHTYSGTSFNPGELARKSKDRVVTLPAYVSTSHDKKVAEDFARRGAPAADGDRSHGVGRQVRDSHVIHFHLRKGNKALNLSGVNKDEDDEDYSNEHENLLHRGQRFQISEKPDSYDLPDYDHKSGSYGSAKSKTGVRLHVWHAHPVGDKATPTKLVMANADNHKAWFDRLGKAAQAKYISDHPRSTYARKQQNPSYVPGPKDSWI
jgi:hypothetical protein